MAIVGIVQGVDERVVLVSGVDGSPVGTVGSPLFMTPVGAGSGGTSTVDQAAFTAGVSAFTATGGVFNDGLSVLTSGQQGEGRVTPSRALHVNLRSQAGAEITSFGGVSVTDAAAWTTASSVFVPGGGVFNDSAAALTAGQQGTQRLTAARGQHVALRTTAGADAWLTHNSAAPAALTNLGVLAGLANAAVPTFVEGDQTLLSLNLSGALRAAVEGPTASGAAITRPPIVVAGQASGNVKIWNLTAAGAGVIAGNLGNNTAAPASDFLESLGALANAAVPSWTEGNSVMLSVDLSGRLRTAGTLTNNAAAPGANNQGVLPVIATAAVQSWTEGRQVLLSTDLGGTLRIGGQVASGATLGGNPVLNGFSALAHGANPTAVTAGQAVTGLANRAGIPYMMGGHPNIQTVRANIGPGAVADQALVTVAAGLKIVVTGFLVTVSNATTTSPSVVLGFGTANTPTTTNVIGAHSGVAAGSGFGRGGGAGIIGVGADDADLRITTGAATSGLIDVSVSFFTIES